MSQSEPLPSATEPEVAPQRLFTVEALLRALLHLTADILVPAIWVALIIAIVLFSGVVSQFRYVDF